MYRTHFTVRPVNATTPSRFPLDMLRYDQCCPATQEGVEAISFSMSRPQYANKGVELIAYHAVKAHNLTNGRWQSFGWTIVPNSIGTTKVVG